jgi:hypothetical protein
MPFSFYEIFFPVVACASFPSKCENILSKIEIYEPCKKTMTEGSGGMQKNSLAGISPQGN